MKRLLAGEPDRTAAQRLELFRFMAISPGYGRRLGKQAFRYFQRGFAPWKEAGGLELIRRTLGAVSPTT